MSKFTAWLAGTSASVIANRVAKDIVDAINSDKFADIVVYGDAPTLFADVPGGRILANSASIVAHYSDTTCYVETETRRFAKVTRLPLNSTAGVSPTKLYLLGTNDWIETNVVAPMRQMGMDDAIEHWPTRRAS